MLLVSLTGVATGTEDQDLTFDLGLFVADPDDLSDPMAGLTFTLTSDSTQGYGLFRWFNSNIRTTLEFFWYNHLSFDVSDGQFTTAIVGRSRWPALMTHPFSLAVAEVVDG